LRIQVDPSLHPVLTTFNMANQDPLIALLDHTLEKTELPGLATPFRGKVRDVYDLGDRLLLVTTDRISAFDVVLGTIPCKGQVLNTIAVHWFEQTRDLVPNHILSVPDPCAMVVKKLKPLPIEIVVRRYITGSLWRAYQEGERGIYGLHLPEGLKQDQRFPMPILTPTTKAEIGQHDQPVSSAELIASGVISKQQWEEIERAAFALFQRGEERARQQELILVDTKYEFGFEGDHVTLLDEVHTPDSSRYWELAGYEKAFWAGRPQRMLDKENIRQWLLARGFSGTGPAPKLTDEIRVKLARVYLKLQERLTGQPPLLPTGDAHQNLVNNLRAGGILPN
jgi:phosphoribosylaminoimidazole-succinocarboxamide synthase